MFRDRMVVGTKCVHCGLYSAISHRLDRHRAYAARVESKNSGAIGCSKTHEGHHGGEGIAGFQRVEAWVLSVGSLGPQPVTVDELSSVCYFFEPSQSFSLSLNDGEQS